MLLQTCYTIVLIFTGLDGSPVRYTSIHFNGTLLTTTNGYGSFSFSVPDDIVRMPLLFQDTFLKSFMDTSYVLEIPKGYSGEMYITVTMFERENVVEILSTEENEITLTSNATGRDLCSIVISANSFYTESGELYQVAYHPYF